MIYLDNAATTNPKPRIVINAVEDALKNFSANPGRAGHHLAYNTAEKVYETRKSVADFFGVDGEEKVIFTSNCTTSLNFVIKGLAKKGGHFICSSLEHNAVARPLQTLSDMGICSYSVATVEENEEETIQNFKKLLNSQTIAIVCTAASNVFGKMLPLKKLATLAHENGLFFVVDAAQSVGLVEINCKEIGIDYLCIAAHKGLYAPMSTGILICCSDNNLNTIIEGGTGNLSAILTQPDSYPERFESGTINVPNILGLSAGIEFVKNKGINKIYQHENNLVLYLYSKLTEIKKVKLYTNPFSETEKFTPTLSFNIEGLHSEETAEILSENEICVRAGYHCAPLAHKTYGTLDTGTVRVAPSAFTTTKDMNILLNSVFKIANNK